MLVLRISKFAYMCQGEEMTDNKQRIEQEKTGGEVGGFD